MLVAKLSWSFWAMCQMQVFGIVCEMRQTVTLPSSLSQVLGLLHVVLIYFNVNMQCLSYDKNSLTNRIHFTCHCPQCFQHILQLPRDALQSWCLNSSQHRVFKSDSKPNLHQCMPSLLCSHDVDCYLLFSIFQMFKDLMQNHKLCSPLADTD